METLSDTELIRHRTAEEHSLRIRPLELGMPPPPSTTIHSGLRSVTRSFP